MDELIKNVENKCTSSFLSRKDDKGRLVRNIANFGLPIYGTAILERNGEYKGFSIQVLEEVKPLLTEARISKALKYVKIDDMPMAIRELHLENDVIKYGINIIYYVIEKWLGKNKIIIPEKVRIFDHSNELNTIDKLELVNNWIYSVRHDPLPCKVMIVGIGKSKKGNSVVPDSWNGKIFDSGELLHSEMNNLEWRKGKAPVSYCCIYSMTILDSKTWYTHEEAEYLKPTLGIIIKFNELFITRVKEFDNDEEFIEWISKIDDRYDFICQKNKFVIACIKNDLFNTEVVYKKTENVGVLVSRMQKCIRRGSGCVNTLIKTISQLSMSPSYNLPDQQFVKVSGTRQLLWRLFISIIEDVAPFEKSLLKNDANYLTLLDLISLALIANLDPNCQINSRVLELILNTAMFVQNYSYNWNWRLGDMEKTDLHILNDPDDHNVNSFKLALRYMHMMAGDREMLTRCINYVGNYQLRFYSFTKKIKEITKLSIPSVEEHSVIASYDMHCNPNIILYLQASFPDVSNIQSTKWISGFIWDYSSRLNYRHANIINVKDMIWYYGNEKLTLDQLNLLNILKEIQKYLSTKLTKHSYCKKIKINVIKNAKVCKKNGRMLTPLESRIVFQLLFGQKYKLDGINKKNPALEVVVAGTPDSPCKVKKAHSKDKYTYLENDERYNGEKRYIEEISSDEPEIYLPPCIPSFKWIFNKKVKLSGKITKSNEKEFKNDIIFKVTQCGTNKTISMKPFDGRKLVNPIDYPLENEFDKNDMVLDIIKQALYINSHDLLCNQFEINLIMREIASKRLQDNDLRIFNWVPVVMTHKNELMKSMIWKFILAKIATDDEIQIGPIDRAGNKTHNSISYKYEGLLWRLLNMLSMIYPDTISLVGEFKYKLNREALGYVHLISSIIKLSGCSNKKNEDDGTTPLPTVTTKLWNHQRQTTNKIIDGIKLGRRGFGDASCVGSGKTLTAISVMSDIVSYNNKLNSKQYTGFLILLPSSNLYNTWIEEIKKHTTGFDICLQSADGKINKKTINQNTIVITTMGRNREHPLVYPWQMVIIDECLTTQNRDSLQSEEAWKQIAVSQYGTLLLSASFFRSRFDKLFYMLKMLKSGFPEKIEYLDTILNECMVCNMVNSTRKWITNITKFNLDENIRKQYDKIASQTKEYSDLYIELSKYLYDSVNYISYFEELVHKIEKEDKSRRILIYARSKNEADNIAEKIKNVSRFPELNKPHTVLSYSEGTFGLNCLVVFDTILTRPPYPDHVPQMCGRLDRPNQKAKILHMEYILIDHTIEEGALYRLEMANNFYQKYIMPLAEFYKVAVTLKLS